jgi:hypothetical protein
VVTNLGLLIEDRFRFGRHVTKIYFKDSVTLHRLRLLKLLTLQRHSFLRPHYFYCDLIFPRSPSVDGRRLSAVGFNLCRYDHVSVNRIAFLGVLLFVFFDFSVFSFFIGWFSLSKLDNLFTILLGLALFVRPIFYFLVCVWHDPFWLEGSDCGIG